MTSYIIPIGTGIRLYRRGLATSVNRANFFGTRYTNAVTPINVSTGWVLLGWTYDTTTNYPTGENLWGLPAGAGGTATETGSDYLWIQRTDGSFVHVRVDANANKLYYVGGAGGMGEATGLTLDGGFWYFNHQATNVVWTPQRPQ